MDTLPITSELQQDAGGEIALPPVPTQKRRGNKEELAGTLLASLPLIGYLVFGFIPLILAMTMAFMEVPGYTLQGWKPVGMDNFKAVWDDPMFWGAVGNTLILGSSTLISLVLALGVAYLLNQNIVFKKGFRMIYFIPYVCSVVAVSVMWKYMFNPNYGVINHILGRTGDNAIDWIGDPKYYSWMIIIISVWSGMGYGIIMFTAALTGVNRSLVEAARIDGAGPLRVFVNVVIPAISPTTFFLLVTGVIGALQSFAMTNVITPEGGPNSDGVTVVFYLYRKIFSATQLDIASAAAWILTLLILVITVIQFVGSKKWVHHD